MERTSKFMSLCCIGLSLCCGTLQVRAQQPAFSGAEGFGGLQAPGGFANAQVYRVTKLDDMNPSDPNAVGTLRHALRESGFPAGGRIIVFDVGGTINLTQGSLDIKNLPRVYIAGQTAPSPITVYGNTTQITSSNNKVNENVIVRYMSFRKGTGGGSDSITFAGGGLGTNLILDHVSASWSQDEILSVANNNTNVTVQYSIISDALVNNHAYGSLIRPRIESNVSFHHNLYAHNASRQARFGTYNGELLTADFTNNVIYNWRDRASYSGGSSESHREYADINFVGNYLIAGPGTVSNANTAFVVDKNVTTRVYQAGNFIDGDKQINPGGIPNGSNTGWGMFNVQTGGDKNGTLEQMASPFSTPAVTTQSALDAYWQVINHVGNSWWDRDVIDARVINNVLTNTGPVIGAAAPIASELDAVLNAPLVSRPAGWDSDGDGMPDHWELKHGLNPNNANDWKQDFAGDGYTNLEHYLNEIGAFPAPAPIVFSGESNNRYAQITNWRTDDGGLTTGSHWQPSRFDLAVIESGSVVVDSVGQHAGLLLIGPNEGDNAELNLTSGWLEAQTAVEVGSAVGAGKLVINPAGLLVAPAVYVGAAGTIEGSGEIVGNVFSSGFVSPGNSVGTLEVGGDFVQDASGRLRMEIASASSFDQLQVGGLFMAGGVLEIALLSYAPQDGDSFKIFDFASVAGALTLELPVLADGLQWDASELLVSGELAISSASNPTADFDGDGVVDGHDFLAWQTGFGNGTTNGSDLANWQAQFGTNGDLLTASVTVPEPHCLTLLIGGLLLWSGRRQGVLDHG